MKAFFWDPLGDPSACGPITDRFGEAPEQDLYIGLARAAAAHPIAYAEHRAMHWNSTERWLVPPDLTDAGPPDEAEPNDLGLQSPRSPVDARLAIGRRGGGRDTAWLADRLDGARAHLLWPPGAARRNPREASHSRCSPRR